MVRIGRLLCFRYSIHPKSLKRQRSKRVGGNGFENKKVKTIQLYKKIKVVTRLGLCVCLCLLQQHTIVVRIHRHVTLKY
jgi:hypothetical protein